MPGWWPISDAKQEGVLQFEADVLPENKAMLAVFARCGLPMEKKLKRVQSTCHGTCGRRHHDGRLRIFRFELYPGEMEDIHDTATQQDQDRVYHRARINSRYVMEKLLMAGMNVARLNFSHGDFSGHLSSTATSSDW